MNPVKYNVEVYQNAVFRFTIKSFDDSGGNPIDISAYAGVFSVRRSMNSESLIFELESGVAAPGVSSLVFSATEPVISVIVSAIDTAGLPTNNMEANWIYELVIWDPNDKPNTSIRLVEGIFNVKPSITRGASM